MAAALILLPIAASADAGSALGDFHFAWATIANASQLRFAAATGAKIAPGSGGFEWKITAAHVVVNWTRAASDEIGRPPDFSQPLYVRDAGTTYGQNVFDAADANSSRRGPLSQIVVWSDKTNQVWLPSPTDAVLRPAQGTNWTTKASSPQLSTTLPLLPRLVEAIAQNGTAMVVGSFAVYVRDAAVQVRNQTSGASFESGRWTDAALPNPIGSPPVRHRYDQIVRLNVTNGTLSMRWHNQTAQVVAGEAQFDGNVSGTLNSAQGTIRLAQEEATVAKAFLPFTGAETFRASNESGSPRPLRGTLVAPPIAFGLMPRTHEAHTPPSASHLAAPSSGFSWVATILVAPILAASAVAVVRQRLRPTQHQAEVALWRGNPEQAHGIASRLLRRDPSNPELVFLLGASLAAQNRLSSLTIEVETAAKRLPVQTRQSIAFMLAVAHLRQGNTAAGSAWATEAANDQHIRRRIMADPSLCNLLEGDHGRGQIPGYA